MFDGNNWREKLGRSTRVTCSYHSSDLVCFKKEIRMQYRTNRSRRRNVTVSFLSTDNIYDEETLAARTSAATAQ